MDGPNILDSSSKYYDWVLKPQYDDYFGKPPEFRHLINLASSLFHYHEWLFADYSARLHIELSVAQPLQTTGQFWSAVQATNTKFAFIRDIANASKHVALNRNPSTSMAHMANTSIQVATWGSAQWGQGKWDVPYAKIKDGTTDVLFDTCAEELFNYWTNLKNDIAPNAP